MDDAQFAIMSTDAFLGQREKTHSPFAEAARVAQELKRTPHSTLRWHNLPDAQKEAHGAIMTKIASTLSGDPGHPDHAIDIAGYAALIAAGL